MHRAGGFTLLEVMIVVVVIAILAAIAIPSYSDYVTRASLAESSGNLADLRVKMEQYYLDNRRYSSDAAGGTCGIVGGNTPTVPNNRYFTYTCASGTLLAGVGDQTYTLTATGRATEGLDGIAFTIDQAQSRQTIVTAASAMANKGYTAATTTCWVRKKPALC
jgi:type IV pilus assembly protein PilE